MIGNQNEKRLQNLVGFTNGYGKNERPQAKSENVLDGALNRVKAATKQVLKTVKYAIEDLAIEYNKEKTK